MQRVGPLANLPRVLRDLAVNTDDVFADLSFGAAELQDPESRLPFADFLTALHRAATLSQRPELGLSVGALSDHRALGVMGELMATAATLGQALSDNIPFQAGNSGGASAYLIPMGDCAAFGFGVYDRFHPGAHQACSIAIAVMLNLVRALSGGKAHPVEVQFSCRAPADPRPFENILQAPVRFNQPQTCVLIARDALATVNPTADPGRRARLLASIAEQLRLGELSTCHRLRHLLLASFLRGETSLACFARQLGLSVRTLDRRLAAEGTSFRAELDAVRFVVARQLLALTDLPVGDVSAAVSYANDSAFIRSFRRWSGLSPTRWRQLPQEGDAR